MRSASLALLLATGSASAAVVEDGFTETVFARSNTISGVTGMAWAPDGSNRLFLIQKNGQIRIVTGGVLNTTVYAAMSPIYTNSECGLIGLAFDPAFRDNKLVYLFVTVSGSEQQILRYRDRGDGLTDRTVLVRNLPTKGVNHDGGGLGFGWDGRVYWSIGDQGDRTGVDLNTSTLAAKIGRANADGSTPGDNPFADGPGGAHDLIWSRGFRNPFTLTFQPSTGLLWVNDVGDQQEQVFVVRAGDHAGWDDYEINQPAGYILPVIKYRTNGTDSRAIVAGGAVRGGGGITFTTSAAHRFRLGEKITVSGVGDGGFNGTFYVASIPSSTTFTVPQAGASANSGGGTAVTQNMGGSLTGGAFYDSTAFPATHWGSFFFGDYNSGKVFRAGVDAANNVTRVDEFATGIPGAVDVTVGPDGAVYAIGHDYANPTVYRYAFTPVAQGLIVSETNLRLVEGATGVLMARLAMAPSADVVVGLAHVGGDADLAVSGAASATFTPTDWSTPKPFVLAAAQDIDTIGDAASFTFSTGGLPSRTVSVTARDDDSYALVLSTTALSMREGETGTVTVRLSQQPPSIVSVNVVRASGDGDLSVTSGSSLSFTTSSWATPQNVVLAAANDVDTADDTATFTVSAPGSTPRTFTVLATDKDVQAPLFTSVERTTAVAGTAYLYDADASGNPAPQFALDTAPAGMTLDSASGLVSWTPGATGSFAVSIRAFNGVLPDAVQSYTLVVSPDAPPTCRITRPTDGETVSGDRGEFFGDGLDDVGTVRALFLEDGAEAYTDVSSGGHFHFGGEHLRWDTTRLAGGPHRLRMVVRDTAGQTGSHEIGVVVANAVPPLPDAGAPPADGPARVSEGCGCGPNAPPGALLFELLALATLRRRPGPGKIPPPIR